MSVATNVFDMRWATGTSPVMTTWNIMEPMKPYIEESEPVFRIQPTKIKTVKKSQIGEESNTVFREEYLLVGITVLFLVLVVIASPSGNLTNLDNKTQKKAALQERVPIMKKSSTKKSISRIAQGTAIVGGIYAVETTAQGILNQSSSTGIIGNSLLLLGISVVGFVMASVVLTHN